MGIMFSSSNFLGMTNLMSVMPVVGYERVVFYRERGASMYDAFAYGIAIALVEMPYLLVQVRVRVRGNARRRGLTGWHGVWLAWRRDRDWPVLLLVV